MTYNIETYVGRIFCKYNPETDDFDKIRLISVDNSNGTDEKIYVMAELDEHCHAIHTSTDDGASILHLMTQDQFDEIKKEYTILSSEGIMAITNIIAAKAYNDEDIRDVLAIFYPNNKMTKVPDAAQPYIVARQGVQNIFSPDPQESGASVSLETLPDGYTLADFMANLSVLNSHLTHVYKTDTARELEFILENKDTTDILEDLFNHSLYRFMDLDDKYEKERHGVTKDSILNGYCRRIKTFLESTDFMYDLYTKMNIITVDFAMEADTPLDIDQKLFCASLLGGERIDKAVPLMFDYTINMDAIKMKYFLAIDTNDILWIVPYTKSPDEIDPKVLYDLTEERTITLQNRLKKVVRAYDKSVEEKGE